MTTEIDITTYIPQRAPFVMVDEVLEADERKSRTSFAVRGDNIFVVKGVFTEPGLVENMAQTAAAGTGYRYHKMGTVVPVGFIASIKSLKIYSLPKEGQTLHTETEVVHTVMNVHVVQAIAYVGEEKVASCEMKIFEQSETPKK